MFVELAEFARKSVESGPAVLALERHVGEGTLPPNLKGSKAPSFVTTKEFKVLHAQRLKASADAHDLFLQEELVRQLELRRAEAVYFDEKCTVTKIIPTWLVKIQNIGDANKESMKRLSPTWFEKVTLGQVALGAVPGDDDWVYDESFLHLWGLLTGDIAPLLARYIALCKAPAETVVRKKTAKREIRDAASGKMETDADDAEAKQKKLVDARVEAALKKRGVTSTAHPPKKVRKTTNFDLDYTNSITSELYPDKRQAEGRSFETRGASQRQVEDGGKAAAEDQEARAIEEVISSSWRWDDYSAYPDAILTIPFDLAVYIVYSRVPDFVKAATRFRSHVHYGPGVYVPDNIAIHLSAGLKFMFPSRINFDLIKSAYKEFERVMRWKLKFSYEGRVDNEPYDPDYEVQDDRPKTNAPKLPAHLETGLLAGRAFVDKYVIEHIDDRTKFTPDFVEIRKLRYWLEKNNLIVLPTDKNLGCAVVKADWVIRNTLIMLSDVNSYVPITNDQLLLYLYETRTFVDVCALLAADTNKQLAKWLVSCHEPDEHNDRIPTFYCIPKIHKKPWALRPIVPCHSNIQAPLAKFISKELKPILAEQPFILKGTKDLAQRLAQTQWSTKKKWLVTGDIVAFYPNIPVKDATDIVEAFVTEYHDRHRIPGALDYVLRMGLRSINKRLIFKFQGQRYLQKDGLAMGLGCSPDIANLYAAHFEDIFLAPGSELSTKMPFFGRYIDDCFGVVEANTRAEVSAILEPIKYGPLTLVWNIAEVSTSFLDMRLHIDLTTGRVEHQPFKKAMNHHERIPYVSHHPPDVKRGTFISEMSRLATLSSQRRYYNAALLELHSMYFKRGYPKELLDSWIENNANTRWENRLRTISEEGAAVNVMKTKFNPVWYKFPMKDLWTTMKRSWNAAIRDPGSQLGAESVDTVTPDSTIELINRRFLLSRSRNRQMADAMAVMRKMVLKNALDEPDDFMEID